MPTLDVEQHPTVVVAHDLLLYHLMMNSWSGSGSWAWSSMLWVPDRRQGEGFFDSRLQGNSKDRLCFATRCELRDPEFALIVIGSASISGRFHLLDQIRTGKIVAGKRMRSWLTAKQTRCYGIDSRAKCIIACIDSETPSTVETHYTPWYQD